MEQYKVITDAVTLKKIRVAAAQLDMTIKDLFIDGALEKAERELNELRIGQVESHKIKEEA